MNYDRAKTQAREIYNFLLGKKFRSKDGHSIEFFSESTSTTIFDNSGQITIESADGKLSSYTIDFYENKYRILIDDKIYFIKKISSQVIGNSFIANLLIEDTRDNTIINFDSIN